MDDRTDEGTIGARPPAILESSSWPVTSSITSAWTGARAFDGVDLADVRVIERRQRLGFPLETTKPVRILGKRLGQDFQGDVAIERCVSRPVDLAHSPCAKLGDDAIRAKDIARLHRLVSLAPGDPPELRPQAASSEGGPPAPTSDSTS